MSYFSSGESFSKENLIIEYQINGKYNSWSPQPYTEDSLGGNLGGTVRVSLYSLILMSLILMLFPADIGW